MKKVLVLLFLTILTASVIPQDKLRTIRVTGTASIEVVPDKVMMYIDVEERGNKLHEVKRTNEKNSKTITDILLKSGVKSENIHVLNFRIIPQYKGNYWNKEIANYISVKSLEVQINNLSLLDTVLNKIFESDLIVNFRLVFSTSEEEKYKQEASILAVKKTVEKAKLIANELGQKVGKPITIVDTQSNINSKQYKMNTFGGSSANDTFSKNTISIVSTVHVTFELE